MERQTEVVKVFEDIFESVLQYSTLRNFTFDIKVKKGEKDKGMKII